MDTRTAIVGPLPHFLTRRHYLYRSILKALALIQVLLSIYLLRVRCGWRMHGLRPPITGYIAEDAVLEKGNSKVCIIIPMLALDGLAQ